MEPNIPTSFIPKRPLAEEPAHRMSQNPLGLVSLITTVLFFATILASGGIFLYERQLMAQRAQMEVEINKAKEGLGAEFITDMKKLDNRITAIKELIQNHIVVSPIFEALQDSTLRSVQYKNFAYAFGSAAGSSQRVVSVEMNGTAKNYETIALQSEAFSKSSVIKDAVFSNLTVDEKKGVVNFSLRFSVAAADLSYQAFIDALQRPAPGALTNPNATTL
ncbi:MAG TPA: hypothetical protein VLB02_01065 [Candidatus Paceibacterota bacterium]|nr:hypothetical protein [Candidatus Paceibacterota bacterium]